MAYQFVWARTYVQGHETAPSTEKVIPVNDKATTSASPAATETASTKVETTATGARKAGKFYLDMGTQDVYPSNLYDVDEIATALAGAAAVDDAAVRFYQEQGYLAVADLFSPQQVEDAKEALSDLIAGRNEKFNGIHLEHNASDQAEAEEIARDVKKMEAIVRKVTNFTDCDSRLKAMLDDKVLRQIVDRLGGEPMRPSQEMALLKPPHGREKPWHQDHAYFKYDLKKHFVGVWIALDEATIANGCMHLLPGKHREPVIHFKRRDWQICDATTLQMKQAHCTAVPLKPGGVLFFDSYLPHGTPTNNTNQRRRAIQFHYRAVSTTPIEEGDHLAVWGSEGKNVEC